MVRIPKLALNLQGGRGAGLLIALLLGGMPSRAEQAPGSLNGFELGLGGSRQQLQPEHGDGLTLSGGFLSGRVGWGKAWSLESVLWRQGVTDDHHVELRQWGVQAGPRYTWTLAPRVEVFAHLLAGGHRLEAQLGSVKEWKATFSATPGLGVDVLLGRGWVARAQVDEVFTHFAGQAQHGLAGSAGVAFRWGRGRAAAVPVQAPRSGVPQPVSPAPEVAAAPAPVVAAPRVEPAAPGEPAAVRARPESLRIPFGPGSSAVAEGDLEAIRALASRLKGAQGYEVQVSGHASRIGRGNQPLSERRAQAVVEALTGAGLPGARIRSRALGFHEPAVPDTTRANRARNRRVEIRVEVE